MIFLPSLRGKKTPPLSRRLHERGSLFAALFGAVAMTGVLALGVNAVMKGPIATMGEVSRKNIAENNMIASTRLAIIMSTSAQAGGGDCDADGYIEPLPYRNAGTSPKPTGGGYLPSSIGASMIDPWQTEYGYCVWDHGTKTTTDNVVACGGSAARRLKGAPKPTQIAIAVISAGKDKTFQTTCNAFVDANADGNPDTALLNKPAGSDDIVLGYTYAEAGKIGGSLWNIKAGEPGTAEIGNRDIEIKGSDGATAARIGYDAGLGVSGVGDFGAVKSDQVFSKSGAAPINLNGIVRAQNVTGLAAPVGGAPAAPPPAAAASQIAYTTPGSYTWTAPAGVTSISLVAVGGGGGGAGSGALAGGNSSFNSTIVAYGGGAATSTAGGAGGGRTGGDGGGTGGTGGNGTNPHYGGGGGAGGYTGNGGNGGSSGGNGTAGTGGGGGGGGGGVQYNYSSGGGGGVGILGLGTSGAAGIANTNAPGKGGSGGANGSTGSNSDGSAGKYGGGGNSSYGYAGGGGGGGLVYKNNFPVTPGNTYVVVVGAAGDGGVVASYKGGGGAVRIIWPGNERSFPSTRTADE